MQFMAFRIVGVGSFLNRLQRPRVLGMRLGVYPKP